MLTLSDFQFLSYAVLVIAVVYSCLNVLVARLKPAPRKYRF
jgi:hypothetical protein